MATRTDLIRLSFFRYLSNGIGLDLLTGQYLQSRQSVVDVVYCSDCSFVLLKLGAEVSGLNCSNVVHAKLVERLKAKGFNYRLSRELVWSLRLFVPSPLDTFNTRIEGPALLMLHPQNHRILFALFLHGLYMKILLGLIL